MTFLAFSLRLTQYCSFLVHSQGERQGMRYNDVYFMAPPAGGKGTQSQLLESMHRYLRLVMSDIIDAHNARDKSSSGLVDDEVVIKLFDDHLVLIDQGVDIAMDGFPRSAAQVLHAIKRARKHARRIAFLDIVVSDEICFKHLDTRREDALRMHGKVIRADDEIETYKDRLSRYHDYHLEMKKCIQTEAPETYKRVSGEGSISEVQEQIATVLHLK